MRTTLTIECDIIDAQKILYKASKIIRNGEMNRDQERLCELVSSKDADSTNKEGAEKCLSE